MCTEMVKTHIPITFFSLHRSLSAEIFEKEKNNSIYGSKWVGHSHGCCEC